MAEMMVYISCVKKALSESCRTNFLPLRRQRKLFIPLQRYNILFNFTLKFISSLTFAFLLFLDSVGGLSRSRVRLRYLDGIGR